MRSVEVEPHVSINLAPQDKFVIFNQIKRNGYEKYIKINWKCVSNGIYISCNNICIKP